MPVGFLKAIWYLQAKGLSRTKVNGINLLPIARLPIERCVVSWKVSALPDSYAVPCTI